MNEHFKLDAELYKFTNVQKFFENIPVNQPTAISIVPEVDPSLATFIFVDGTLTVSPEIPGLKVSENLKNIPLKDGPLSALHHEKMSEGLSLEVSHNTTVSTPVRVLHYITTRGIKAPTLSIKMGRNSKLSLLEEIKGAGEAYGEVNETYIQVEAGANLEHIQLGVAQSQSVHHHSIYASVEKDATYKNFLFHIQGAMLRTNLSLKLCTPGANGETYALFLAQGEEHSDINTVIEHLAEDTTSNQVAKGILAGKSKGIFTGKIHIHKDAQRVSSGQINRNLLLSSGAQVHSQPQLEIFANDVKCSHGSTTGALSEEELFYFESRGIPENKARTLLAHGFGLEIVQKIESTILRQRLAKIVLSKLEEKFQL